MTETPGTPPDPALVRVDSERGIRTLTLDSPSNRNALSTPLLAQLSVALADATADDTVRVVVLSHTGPVFCSGADLKETAAAYATGPGAAGPGVGGPGVGGPGAGGPGGTDQPLPAARLVDVLAAIWESPKPVLARAAGPARAGGLGLLAAADIAVCAEEATFAFSEVRLGVIPAVISATVLPRLTPRAASELYLTGDVFDGRRAAEVGLVTAAVPAEALDAAVAAYCQSLVRGGPVALAGAKALLRRARASSMRAEVADLAAISTGYFRSTEGMEGVLAFREKRDPNWVPAG